MIVFLKAAIRGGAAADLFPTQVDVSGYTNKRGTYVAPHQSVRHKRATATEHYQHGPAQGALFGDAAAPQPTAQVQALPPSDGLHKLAEFITRHGGREALGAQLQRAKPADRARAVKLMASIGGLSPAQVEVVLGLAEPAGQRAEEPAHQDAEPDVAPAPREGDTKTEDGVTYVMRDGRWHRNEEPPRPRVRALRALTEAERDAVKADLKALGIGVRVLKITTPLPAGRIDVRPKMPKGNDLPRFSAEEVMAVAAVLDKHGLATLSTASDGKTFAEAAEHRPTLYFGDGFHYVSKPVYTGEAARPAPVPPAAEAAPPAAPAPEDPAPAPAPADAAPEIVEHVTRRGKTIRGVIRRDLTHSQAKAIDEYTFKKDGGWFIREKHLDGLPPVGEEVSTAEPAPTQPKAAAEDVVAAAERELKRRQAQAAKLRDVANALGEKAEESLGRDRNANTARRARMAASAEDSARHDLRIAETLRNIAAAIENGEAKYLANVSSKAAVEELDSVLRQAKYERARAQERQGSRTSWDDVSERPVTVEDIRHARMPTFSLNGGTARNLIEAAEVLGVKRGHAKTLNWLREFAHSDLRSSPTGDQMNALRALVSDLEPKVREHRDNHSSHYTLRNAASSGAWAIRSVRDLSAQRSRFEKLGITNDLDLQRTLAEYMIHRGGTRSEDPVKRMERELVGNKSVGVDFFPTPPALVEHLVQQADIKPGMKVLEPSAGKGDIADAARVAGGDVDTVELSGTLRGILETKGHRVAGHDFESFEPAEGGYDRIVMNPPFSNGLDADHVRRAYDMLKPGGRLVAITGEGIHFREDRKARDFRDWLDTVGGTAEKLPEGSFKSAFRPTGVATRLVVIDKPEDAAPVGAPAKEEAAAEVAGPLKRRNYSWDAVKLSDAYSADELVAWAQEIRNDPANANPDHAAGRSIYLYTKDARKKLDALSWAIRYRMDEARRADGETVAKAVAPLADQESADPAWTNDDFDTAAARLAAEKGDAFTAEDLAGRWRGRSAEDVLDMLHARHGDYAVLPSGEHFMRLDDYLRDADPVETLRQVQTALAAEHPPHVRERLQRQAQKLTEAALQRAPSASA